MKIKTNELTDAALDWAVALADNHDEGWLHRQIKNPNPDTRAIPHYSTDWSQGGPIIEREKITPYAPVPGDPNWSAFYAQTPGTSYGPTPLIAAMRCYVASKLGDEVDVPKELT